MPSTAWGNETINSTAYSGVENTVTYGSSTLYNKHVVYNSHKYYNGVFTENYPLSTVYTPET